jgi:cathepsin B
MLPVLAVTLHANTQPPSLRAAINDTLIAEVNQHEHARWKAGRNAYFEGKTIEDVQRLLGLKKGGSLHTVAATVNMTLPLEYDARDSGCVGPVLDQGECGSCWAFGASEAMSDRLCLSRASKGGSSPSFVQLSTLQLVTCLGLGPFSGCNGGFAQYAWQYAQQEGLVEEACEPYLVSEGGPIPTCAPEEQPCLNFTETPECQQKCHDGSSTAAATRHKLSDSYQVPAKAMSIQKEIQANGPVEAGFTVYEDFVHYKSGVYSHTTGKELGGHAVKIVGWGSEGGDDYWQVQNSWTTLWGDKGYFKILRGLDECGIEETVYAGTW